MYVLNYYCLILNILAISFTEKTSNIMASIMRINHIYLLLLIICFRVFDEEKPKQYNTYIVNY